MNTVRTTNGIEGIVIPGAAAGDGESPGPENGPEGDGKPLVRDPKQAWVDHAVEAGGADPAEVAAMTKADLIEKYGNPPA